MAIGRHRRKHPPPQGTEATAALVATRVVVRLAGAAIGVTAFLNGFTEPNVGGRSDQIQAHMAVIDAVLSLAWAPWPIGMWLATTVGGRVLERFGTRTILVSGATCYWGAFAFLGLVDGPVRFALVMFFVGVGNGFFDVAWARLGPWYEFKRQEIDGAKAGLSNQFLNGLFSLGSVAAAVVTMLAVGYGVPISWHLAGVGALALLVTLGWAGRHLPNLKATDSEDGDAVEAEKRSGSLLQRLRSTPRALRWAGILGFCAGLPIGVGYVWSAILLKRLDAEAWLVPAGLLAFTSSEMVVRFGVGWLSKRTRWFADPVKLTVTGGIMALLGIGLIVLPGRVDLAIVGFGLLAGGMGPIAPLAQSAGQRLWPKHKGAAAALITRYVYTALVLGPTLIGPLSSGLGSTDTSTPLRIALAGLAVLPLVVIWKARSLRAARPQEIV